MKDKDLLDDAAGYLRQGVERLNELVNPPIKISEGTAKVAAFADELEATVSDLNQKQYHRYE